jgi:hypothetical protein
MIEYLTIETRSSNWGESIMLQRTMRYVLLSCLLITNALSATSEQQGIKGRALELAKNKKTKIAAGAAGLTTVLLVLGYRFHQAMVENRLKTNFLLKAHQLLDEGVWLTPEEIDTKTKEQEQQLRLAKQRLEKTRATIEEIEKISAKVMEERAAIINEQPNALEQDK